MLHFIPLHDITCDACRVGLDRPQDVAKTYPCISTSSWRFPFYLLMPFHDRHGLGLQTDPPPQKPALGAPGIFLPISTHWQIQSIDQGLRNVEKAADLRMWPRNAVRRVILHNCMCIVNNFA